MEDSELFALVDEARLLYKANAGSSWLVAPAAPVLFFGDLPRYRESQPRIATVALNPSHHEFPTRTPFRRFVGADSPNGASYLASLIVYFQTAPYDSWFGFYEQALLGMGASYYGRSNAVALHTDICSVLPTNPTWSSLGDSTRRQLAEAGIPLWHRLIDYIKPDILLWSTARKWLERIEFRALTEWEQIALFDLTKDGKWRTRPVGLEARWYSLSTGAPVLVAYARPSEKPLASLSHAQKWEAGRIIREHWSHGV